MNTNTRTWIVDRSSKLAWLMVAFALAMVGARGAMAEDAAPRPIGALAYNTSTGDLLKIDDTGLYSSQNDGRTWEAIAGPLPANGTVTSIVATPGEDSAVYVAGPSIGILRAGKDGGGWTAVDGGLPSSNITALAGHSTQRGTLHAYLPESGIYRTRDAGASWKLMDRGPANISQLIHTNMAGSMETGWLYAATAAGVRFSMDCFCLWREANGLSGPVSAIAVDPTKPERLYAASDNGVFLSSNGGQDWQAVATLPEAVTALVMTPSAALYAGTVGGLLLRSSDGAKTWEQVDE